MLPQMLLDQFRNFLAETIGLYFPKEDPKILEKKLIHIAESEGKEDAASFLQQLMTPPITQEVVMLLAHHLTIGETYFFRDSSSFALLEKKILPDIIRKQSEKKRSLRIWCAGCATGEEPYSIAIVLHQLISNIQEWDIMILGTDINKRFLQKAEKAEYKKWSFRTTTPEIKERYFKKTKEDLWTLTPEIHRMVAFAYLNLIDLNNPNSNIHMHDMDLITCNNVFIYFAPKQIATTIHHLTNALSQDGWLWVTAIEAPYVQDPQLVAVNFGHTILFKKGDEASQKLSAIPSPMLDVKETTPAFKGEDSCLKVILPAFLKPRQPILEFPFSANAVSESLQKPINALPLQTERENNPHDECEKLYQQGLYKDVIDKLEKELASVQNAVDFSEKQRKRIILLVRAYANLGLLGPALMWCERTLKADPSDPILYCLYATILQEQGRIPEAIQSLKRALYINSNFIIAHFALGCLTWGQEKFKEAERCFRNALQLLKKYPPDTVVDGSDGITAGGLTSIILSQKRKSLYYPMQKESS